MKKTYKYRIYPTNQQIKSLENTFYLCRFLYNCALEERINYYKKYGKTQKSLNYNYQQNLLPQIKDLFPEFNNIHSKVLQATLARLENAYKGFFRRVKKGETPGFPRFKSQDRFKSITYTQSGFSLEKPKGKKGNKKTKIYLSKIGKVPLILHRNIKGTPKNCHIIKTTTNKWYVCLVCEVQNEPLTKTNQEIGIDL